MDGKASVVVQNVGVSASAILPVDHHVGLHIISVCFVDAHGVEGPRIPCHISRARFELCGRSVCYSEASVIVCNVLVTIVSTLSETFLESISFVD